MLFQISACARSANKPFGRQPSSDQGSDTTPDDYRIWATSQHWPTLRAALGAKLEEVQSAPHPRTEESHRAGSERPLGQRAGDEAYVRSSSPSDRT